MPTVAKRDGGTSPLHAVVPLALGSTAFCVLYWGADTLFDWSIDGGTLASHVWPAWNGELWARSLALLCLLAASLGFAVVPIRRERRLAEMRNRLRRAETAWDMSYQHVTLLHRDGRVLEANHASMELVGIRIEEIRGRLFWECPGWEDPLLAATLRRFCGLAAAGERGGFLGRISSGGRVREMDIRVRPIPGADGEVDLILVEAHDITELRRTQQELETTSRLLQTVLDTTPVSLFWKDRDGRFLGCNTAFARDLGASSSAEIVGRRDAELLPEQLVEQFRASDRIVLETGGARLGVEEPIRFPGLPDRWIRISELPLRDESGAVSALLGSYEDITDARALREELERHRLRIEGANAELEERVKERTRDLLQVNRELETFAHSAAHDLRTPLRAIDGWTHAVLEESGGVLGEEGRERLGRVRAAAQRIGESLDDLLRLSQVARSDFQPAEVDMARLARAQRELLSAMHPERWLEWTIPPRLPVTGDPELLRILLWNLLENAVKFTASRAIARIEIGAHGRGIFVRDNGVGFDMAHVGKLFDAFQRLHLPEDFAGTGIGLAVVRRIAERHGGHVEAEGTPDRGATFRFVPD